MNKEEIDKIREKYKTTKDNFIDEKYASIRFDISFFKDFEILLNYIDKLQKELKDSINARFELQRRIDKQEKIIDSLAQWVSNLSPMVDKQAVKDIIYKENKYE